MSVSFTVFVYSVALFDSVITLSILEEIYFYYCGPCKQDSYASLSASEQGDIPKVQSLCHLAQKICPRLTRNPKALKFLERVLHRSFYWSIYLIQCLHSTACTVVLAVTGRYEEIPQRIPCVYLVYREFKRAQRAEKWNTATKDVAKLDKQIRQTRRKIERASSRTTTPLENGIDPIGTAASLTSEERRTVRRKLRQALKRLIRHNKNLEEPHPLMPTGECLKCQSRPRSHFLRTCRHLAFCSECAAEIHECPICGTESDVQKAFLE
eukprot:gb/GECG01012782.1/.p1 GENE.gb/GECG01012782.1/~~gb/GECG01012782.1/.p1  ORF type:complete len:267 (+),score=12.38 gb/GECG01012782.1/:1-801(+)